MSANTKVITAHLNFNLEVQLSVQATEVKWKQLTKDYLDPEESWANQAQWIIGCFVEDELAEGIKQTLSTRAKVDLPNDPIFGLKATKPVVKCSDLEGFELEEVG
ncbi:hypothetical protein [Synechococcus sp. HK01-R]|uniref:hypothetical protein n=1 Tax=Synechococcus sp. HK01-R TaxID=2751171 RepID=UPI0016259331|nr:hypothetical protein [Synechococcus sp. HK01-R]QNG26995.1 hypothetical protein H0O21_12595 [Synechococcus sp. HK01-R]